MSSKETQLISKTIFIVSSSTGGTAKGVINGLLRQFKKHGVQTHTFSNITTNGAISSIVAQAKEKKALVVSSFVHPPNRSFIVKQSARHGVDHIELFGTLLDQISDYLDRKPAGLPGLLHLADESYYRRIEAVEFTVRADDGKEAYLLDQAEMVLVGVSRTSKTPLSTYLAHKGYKVANVPIYLGSDPPEALFEVDNRRIFALTIDPVVLSSIRRSRIKSMGLNMYDNYADESYILAELEYSNELFSSNPAWCVTDVTNRAIEETAARITSAYLKAGFPEPLTS